MNNVDDLLTIEEAAALAECYPTTLRHAMRDGHLAPHPISSKVRKYIFFKDDVVNWIEARKNKTLSRRQPFPETKAV